MPLLKLERVSEFANLFRAYHVVLDGERVARVRHGKKIEIEVSPGSHTVELTIDWCRSNSIEIDAREGEIIALRCGSNYTGLRLFRGVSRVVTDSQAYLWLQIVTGPP